MWGTKHACVASYTHTLAGYRDPVLDKLAKCSNSDHANICRNLHRLLAHADFTLQVEISNITISVRHTRSRKIMDIPWPTMTLTSWVRFVMQKQGGQILLSGHHISQVGLWKRALKQFWDLYQSVDPDHPTFIHALDRTCTLPYFLHGDEGRGRSKQPLLVVSFQGIFSHYGDNHLNESGFPGT